jgi:hypothetical protein
MLHKNVPSLLVLAVLALGPAVIGLVGAEPAQAARSVCVKGKRLKATSRASLVSFKDSLWACRKGKRRPVARLVGPGSNTWVTWSPPYAASGSFVAAEVGTDIDLKCGSTAIAIADVKTAKTRYVPAGPYRAESEHVPGCVNSGTSATTLALNRRGVAAFITLRYPTTEGYDVSRTDGSRLVVLAGGPDICPSSLGITLTRVRWDTCIPHASPLP